MKNDTLNTKAQSQYKPSFLGLNRLKTAVVAATVLTLSACGGGGSGGGTPSGPTADSPLSGHWVQCNAGFQSSFTFTPTRWTERTAIFESNECAGSPMADTGLEDFYFEGTYVFVGNSTSEGGLAVQQINMSSDRFSGQPLVESAKVTQYNIVYTGTPGQLVFGDSSTAEAGRPTKLDFEVPYVLR